MPETTVTVADTIPSYWVGKTITIGGAHYVVTGANNTTLTIRHRGLVDRIKSTLRYWQSKIVFLYWDIAEEFIENWEAFNEWRKS